MTEGRGQGRDEEDTACLKSLGETRRAVADEISTGQSRNPSEVLLIHYIRPHNPYKLHS